MKNMGNAWEKLACLTAIVSPASQAIRKTRFLVF